jgi:transposase
MGTARRQFTDEFKGEAVGLLASSGRPLSQIAQELGMAPFSTRTVQIERCPKALGTYWIGTAEGNWPLFAGLGEKSKSYIVRR